MVLSCRCSAILTSVLVLHALAARAQTPTGSIEGFVRDSTGRILSESRVYIVGAATLQASTNGDGKYQIRNVPVGDHRIWGGRIGFLPDTANVTVRATEVVRIDFVLAEAPRGLPDEIIVADPTRGKMGAFNRRKARGVGSFVTRAEIEKRQPASISELLRTLPGVHVSQRMAGEPQPVDMQRSRSSSMQSTCVVQLYVDGQPYPNGNLDDFAPLSLEGVEVYRSASEIPADFRTRNATCGLISLWSRDPEAARRKP
jgi:hypothetical protein